MKLHSFKTFTQLTFEPRALRQHLSTGFLVGTILNLINQGHALLHLAFPKLDVPKFLLTYLVPFLVSAFAAFQAKTHFVSHEPAPRSAHLQCVKCGSEVEVRAEEIVPDCVKCGEEGSWELKVK